MRVLVMSCWISSSLMLSVFCKESEFSLECNKNGPIPVSHCVVHCTRVTQAKHSLMRVNFRWKTTNSNQKRRLITIYTGNAMLLTTNILLTNLVLLSQNNLTRLVYCFWYGKCSLTVVSGILGKNQTHALNWTERIHVLKLLRPFYLLDNSFDAQSKLFPSCREIRSEIFFGIEHDIFQTLTCGLSMKRLVGRSVVWTW